MTLSLVEAERARIKAWAERRLEVAIYNQNTIEHGMVFSHETESAYWKSAESAMRDLLDFLKADTDDSKIQTRRDG